MTTPKNSFDIHTIIQEQQLFFFTRKMRYDIKLKRMTYYDNIAKNEEEELNMSEEELEENELRELHTFESDILQIERNFTEYEIQLYQNTKEYLLCIVNSIKTNDYSNYNVYVEILNLKDNVEHWIILINNFIKRKENPNDKYSFKYLLWCLNYCEWNKDLLINVIKKYDTHTIPFITKQLHKISKCLSVKKQKDIAWVLKEFGITYSIYVPNFLKEIIELTYTDNKEIEDLNLFELIDFLDEKIYIHITKNVLTQHLSNPLLSLHHWFNEISSNFDYEQLIPLFPLCNNQTKIRIIQRFFYYINKKSTNYNIYFLEKLRSNKYDIFSEYRHCLEEPEKPLKIGPQLLIDCLLTIRETNGKEFQTFNGLMDIAIRQCDIYNPKIDFELDFFLPKCSNEGLIPNESFKGFFDYKFIYKINKNISEDSFLFDVIKNILNDYAIRDSYYTCNIDNKIVENTRYCTERIRINHNCSTKHYFKDRWIVDKEKLEWLSDIFLDKAKNVKRVSDNKYIITNTNISPQVFRETILELIHKYKRINTELIEVTDEQTEIRDFRILKMVLEPYKIRIQPFKDSLIKKNSNIFKLAFENKTVDECSCIESKEIYNRITKSLSYITQTELIHDSSNGDNDYFEIPFQDGTLNQLKHIYYFQKRKVNKQQIEVLNCFLTSKNDSIPCFCAPDISPTKNTAINIPFVWCHGKECFQTMLQKQLTENSQWSEYSLYQMTEILGYPQIVQKENIFFSREPIRKFIGIANHVLKALNRLRCRNCGHLIFPNQENNFNQYNYYKCVNPNCSQYQKSIYLSFCYNCKTGLIDSRDSKRCPNGWYICPVCHSCCDDNLYEKMAKKFILAQKSIPPSILHTLGHGHNDKNIYFCHICGKQLTIIYNNGIHQLYCSECDKSYSIVKYKKK